MADALQREVTKRHAIWVNAVVAVLSASGGGYLSYVSQPKPLSKEDVQAVVSAAMAQELTPLREQIAAVKFDSAVAKSDAAMVKNMLATEIKDMSREVVRISQIVARIDERTGGKVQ